MYDKYIKRIIGFLLALSGVICLSWLYIILAAVIKLDSKGPVMFKQKRVAKDKEYFDILKFRTMRIDAPKDLPTHLLSNPDLYTTRIGKFLRKYSLDELPQLFNILKGDMSIIGPRPALWNQKDLIKERDKYGANGVRPGLTGLAQISGRDELPISVKARYDGEYVKRMSFIFDIKIFFATILSVVKHDGFAEGGVKEDEKNKELTTK